MARMPVHLHKGIRTFMYMYMYMQRCAGIQNIINDRKYTNEHIKNKPCEEYSNIQDTHAFELEYIFIKNYII